MVPKNKNFQLWFNFSHFGTLKVLFGRTAPLKGIKLRAKKSFWPRSWAGFECKSDTVTQIQIHIQMRIQSESSRVEMTKPQS